MKIHRFLLQFALISAMVLSSLTAGAVSGSFDDPGGGQYWCNVYVSATSHSKSYSWLTGDSETESMNKFRGFESEHNGTISTQYPSIQMKFRYHYPQSKDFDYDGSDQEIFVMTRDGVLHKIADWGYRLPSWSQTDYTYGVVSDVKMENNYFYFRYTPNELGLAQVRSIQIENETYYHQDNFWHTDYDLQIHARYLRDISMELSRAREANVQWVAPTKVKISADNSWLPEQIGEGVSNFKYATQYDAAVIVDGAILTQTTFKVEDRGSNEVKLDVPIDKDFTVEVTRNTLTSLKVRDRDVSQNLNENEKTTIQFNNTAPKLYASFNQVKGEMNIMWPDPGVDIRNEGEYRVYRTLLTDVGTYAANRELLGSTNNNYFIDGLTRDMQYGKNYRYEVFQLKDSWDPILIPTKPDPLTVVNASEVRVSTVPVIPIHLVRDLNDTENIKFDWDFGNIPNVENDLTFKVHRIEPNGQVTHNYLEVNTTRDSGSASFVDDKPQSQCDIYGYYVQLDLIDNKIHLYSDTVFAHVIDGTTVTSLEASKGISGNSVKIDWTANQVGTAKTTFAIMRRLIGTSDWIKIAQVLGTDPSYSYTDETIEPGRFYQYQVQALVPDCDNSGFVVNNSMIDTGFGQSSGVVNGRVSFDTGTAVSDVHITLDREDDENNQPQLYSRQLLDDGDGLEWHITPQAANNMLRLDKPFTLQMWLNPEPDQQWVGLFGIDGYDQTVTDEAGFLTGYLLALFNYKNFGQEGYVLMLDYAGTNKWFLDSLDRPEVIPINEFTHVTIRNNGDGIIECIINGNNETPHIINMRDYSNFNNPDIVGVDGIAKVKFFCRHGSRRNSYKGFVDDVRVWNRALSDNDIRTTYDRLLGGREDGLKLYWTFDEGLEEFAYDYSRTNGHPNGGHAVIGLNSRPSTITPSGSQLSFYGITNSKGEYEIRGIPFTGSGTRYSVYPSKGIHSFSPTSRSAFIGGTSLTINNVDFTDVSSFKVSGTVRYAGTTIPADSVSFYVDGMPCNKNDKLIMTDKNGEYEISVPIGSHYIEARRNGHTFVNAGRYPATEGETYEFLEDTHLDFYDNTTVILAGRITGGNTEGEKPLGYGQSVNTIGAATIKLSALDHPQRMLNAIEHVDGTTHEWLPNPDDVAIESSSIDINSSSYRGGGDIDDVKYIYITTDARTGEFSAKVPPLRYMVESVRIPKNPDVEQDNIFKYIPAINISNPLDTIASDTIYTENHEPLPLFKCNKQFILTYRTNPVMEITQVGLPAGAFGEDSIAVRDNEQDIMLPIFTRNEATGAVTYNYGYPIFLQRKQYSFKVKAYEPYTNYDTFADGKLYRDVLRDSVVTFDNALGGEARVAAVDTVTEGHSLKRGDMIKLETGQVLLDSVGEATYKWIAGFPMLTAPFTRTLNASMVINGQTKLWSNDGLEGVVSGTLSTGNNFITAGPSYVQMVLRDPPGDASSATWETDTITTKYTYRARGIHQGTEVNITYGGELAVDVVYGVPAFAGISYNTFVNENGGMWKYEVNKTWDYRSYTTFTNQHTVSTSSNNTLVGRNGDVFIGYSTNYIIGAADKVGLFKQEDGSWAIGRDEVISMDEKFGTHFNYSQNYIETTLFNNIKRTRNSKLVHINDKSEINDNPPVPTYYTLLSEDDPKYGSSNDDPEVWGSLAQPDATASEQPSYYARYPDGYEGCDSVHWCNEIIALWKKQLALNEQDKLEAFADNKMFVGNESFETGSTVTHTETTTHRSQHNSVQTFSTTFGYKGRHGILLNKAGLTIKEDVEIGYHETLYDVDETTTEKKYSYTFNDTQRGNAHTVDIYDSPRGWSPIFRTRGGQTRCPYEDATYTKYYKEGTQLDMATMRIENPHIEMLVRNYTGIPAGQEAVVQIKLINQSETHEQFNSAILYAEPSHNPDGLIIKVDGKPIYDGVQLWFEYDKPMTQTITVQQSDPSILDYEDIQLSLYSACSSTRIVPIDHVNFSVHFVPAAPGVILSLDKTVLNQRAVASGEEIVATISDVNRQFTNLMGVRLKYRFAGDDKWITAHEWLTKPEYFAEGHETDVQSLMPTDNANIVYNLHLPDIDGNYMVAAESFCDFDNGNVVATTDEIPVVRDTRGPKLLGQAYPNTGILTPTDDIRIKFNEDIRESYLTKESNFFITGSLNDAQVSHDVSLQFNGNPVETDAYLPISNTSFAATLWLKRKSSGTIIEHGTEGNMFKLRINYLGQVEATINGATISSWESIPMDKWVFLAMNYVKGSNGADNTLTMLMAEDGNETMLFDEAIMPDYNSNGRLTLGRDFTGMMHELVLWNKNTPVRTLLAQKDEVVAPYLPGLVGYWKMNEGHGTTVTDYARSRNIHLPVESWNIENTNLAAHLDGEHTIKIPIGNISPRPADSYVVETWFRGEKNKNARATLLSVTDRVSIGFDYDNSMILHLYNDSLPSYTTNGMPIVLTNVDYNDGNWHHFALNVHRGVSAVVYLDGKAVKTLAEQQLPAPAGDLLYVGSILKRVSEQEAPVESYKFTGDIDELRIWNAASDGTSIIANRYNQIDTAQVTGLVAYYPMQRSVLDANNNIVTEFCLDNVAPLAIEYGTGATIADGVTQASTAPALRKAPLRQNLDFDYTASNNEIYINLNTLPSRMQGNLLTFIVKNVRDLCDNLSETITWSAVVDYGTLEWDDEELTIEKDRLSEGTETARLFNKGRESERFNITGLPNWIEPSVTTGVLGTNESTQVMFTVGANAPVGTHHVYAYAVNDDDICAPLMLHITVTGNDPMWEINPDDYESSMNLTGQIYFYDKICANPNTKIAAFVDGECCGVASPKLMTSRDAYFVSLTIYGVEDTTKSSPVTFRIYDAEQGVVYGNVMTIFNGSIIDLTYQPNGLMGDFDNPLIWQPSNEIDQICDLRAGWNWISLYVQPDEDKNDLESVFGHAKVFNTIKGKDGFAMNSGTKWVSTGLDTVTVGKLYKIKVKNDVNHSIVGTLIDTRTTTQTIYPGWNWIGPLSIYNLSLNEAFADLQPTRGDIVKSKNQVAFYDGYKWEGDLTAVIPGMGYYYKSNSDKTLTFHYPTIDATYGQAPAVVMGAPAAMPFTPVDHHQFSDNMNVVARIMKGDIPVNDLCLAAFIDGECRGATYATSDGLYLLTVAGNADETGKTVRFATYYNGEEVWFSQELSWLSDWIYGDLDEPQLLNLETAGIDEVISTSAITITPTLVTDVINVSADDPLKTVNVYSVNGMVLNSFDLDDHRATLDLSHLMNGVYFVEAYTISGVRSIKKIIKR